MKFDVSQEQGRVPVTVLSIEGDLGDEEAFVSEVKRLIDAGTEYLLLDLTKAPYISSGGLRGLHTVWMLLREDTSEAGIKAIKQGILTGSYKSQHFKLLKPSKNALRALSVSGYDMFLEVHQRLGKAVASF